MGEQTLTATVRSRSRQRLDMNSENMEALERLSLQNGGKAAGSQQSRKTCPRRPPLNGPSLSGNSPTPTRVPFREDTINQIIEQCESHVALILPQLREIRHVSFPASSKGDGLRWSTLLAWLQDTLAQCEEDLKRAIKKQEKTRTAQFSMALQEAESLILSLEKYVPTLPRSTLISESTLLHLRDPTGGSSGELGVMLDAANPIATELRKQRARADMADLSTGVHGYKALILELNELGIVQVPDGTIVSLPDSKAQWLSTLDALESKLMNYSKRISQTTSRLGTEECRVKMGQTIRLRGWIVAARKQHAGTTKRGPYYKPES